MRFSEFLEQREAETLERYPDRHFQGFSATWRVI
jgi:hypothetical protein